ncbi:Sjogren's syndrome/scleroderma autoantigen 1 family protein [Halorubrum sp. CSM-61]|uniref:Sjogren's syndrome/scleroderma autoantigen 1 family protein n=1 Tax=Halorubrum sp. CSM-61 TaxID=2485838 RepID=UPI000F4AFFED|nr:Sjogren's syndrome/scleroderma autoantigen 1 family protein [Halorubrum sp. CSM-61]
MSDGFDKEAEREKLREKFAEDDQKREHTQRMSELLLQGATMTNRHCDDCGDPIFRHDGQEFCPTCQATRSDESAQGGSQESAQTADLEEAGNAPRTVVRTGDKDESQPQKDPGDASASSAAEQSVPSSARQNAATSNAASPPPNAEASRDKPTATPPAEPAGSGTVADARASLTRTLARFARAAEETDDPRRARDHLRAAREAAEALAALD